MPDRRESAAVFRWIELSDRAASLEKAPTSTVLKAVTHLEDGDARLFVEGDGAPVLVRRKVDMIAIGVLRPSLLRQQVVRSALVFKSKFMLSGPEDGVVVDTFGAPSGENNVPFSFLDNTHGLFRVEGPGGAMYVGVEESIELPYGKTPTIWTARLMVDDELFMATAKSYRRMTLFLAALIFAIVVFMGAVIIRIYLVHLDTLLEATTSIAARRVSR